MRAGYSAFILSMPRVGRSACIAAVSLCALLTVILYTRPAIPVAKGTDASIIRMSDDGLSVRIVLEADQGVRHKAFFLSDPSRFVLDVESLVYEKIDYPSGRFVKDVRLAPRPHDNGVIGSRIVVDLTEDFKVLSSFTLRGPGPGKKRLVFDIIPTSDEARLADKITKPGYEIYDRSAALLKKSSTTIVSQKPTNPMSGPDTKDGGVTLPRPRFRPLTILIDPGHGGHDPGALGHTHVREKDIVLDYAAEIGARITSVFDGNVIVKYTRQSDHYVSLGGRVWLAQKYGADIFLSVHADSASSKKVRGASAYVGRVRHRHKQAPHLARSLIGEISRYTMIVDNPVREKGFQVIRQKKIPAVLLEVGFLSNAYDAKNLLRRDHRAKIANAVAMGVKKFATQTGRL